MRSFLVAGLAFAVALAGCTGEGQGRGDQRLPTTAPTGQSNASVGEATFAWAGNFTQLVPFRAHERAGLVIQSNQSGGGPEEQGFRILLVDAAFPSEPTLLVSFVSIQQFSTKKEEDGPRGTIREECLSGVVRLDRTDPPCALVRTYSRESSELRHEPFGDGFFLEPMDGYFLVVGEEISLTVSFRVQGRVSWGQPISLPFSLQYVMSESVNATWQSIQRCGYISWCGNVIGGEYSFEVAAPAYVFLDIWLGLFDGAVGRSCLRSSAGEACAELVPTTSARIHVFRLRQGLSHHEGPFTLTLEAAANGSESGVLRPEFTYSTRILGYSLPDHHPLMSDGTPRAGPR